MNKKAILFILFCLVVSVIIAVVATVGKDNKEPVEIVSGEATLQAQEGKYSVKITKVLEAEPDPAQPDAPEAQSVAIVIYEYTNDDIAHGLAIGNTHFRAYDSTGKELQQYPQRNLFEPSEVGTSGTFTASVAFALNNEDNYLKIEYFNDISARKADVVFEQEW